MRIFDKSGLTMVPMFLGLLFFAASLTPSLIPRDWLVQGILGGLVMALGYLIGRVFVGLWWVMELPTLKGRAALVFYTVSGVPVVGVLALCLNRANDWQNSIRLRMGLELLDSSDTIQMVLVALGVFGLLFLLGVLLRMAFDYLRHRLYAFMPARTAIIAGFLTLGVILIVATRDGILDKVIANLDESVTIAQDLFDTAPPAPTREGIAGGKGSLINWDAMGNPGRDYVTKGPSAASIAEFTGRDALQPIRVYAGLAQADTPQARADVALAELIRLGGFDRKILIVALPTGTGWLDPGGVDTVEYMHGGDIATVAVQYSYLQSPLALILETRSGLDQARALISTVHNYWKTLPKDARPRIYIHGLSLGAWSSMYGTGMFALLDDPINGALWAGPPFPSDRWNRVNGDRNPDSPYVSPTIGDGRIVRFASHTKDAGGPTGWGDIRIVYLQYSSDPIVFYEPASLFRAPEWMREPAAVDVSPHMKFMPVVTQFQLAVDMALANTAPDGYGHAYYGPDYVRPWVAVTDPDNWTEADSARLAAHCDGGFHEGCRN
ncbi:alpha/beta-hydrolase family protein [Sulfitobacter sp. F26169L]|uniref:alpha/beta hydrolase n=1 Tax=Sulfitobacter sp. F26169L TaxID=2996015 RepID=UPI002260F8FF|nr:alpha/beta-hydrolase family protein [Sulfitobacter sp. F26169L]MCX7567386.1 alpha/beta-hydrolase family protein [Sulfitobacter sp. F26169L]